MPAVSPAALKAIKHDARIIAKRMNSSGFRSNTLEVLLTRLDAASLPLFGDRVVQLQSAAAEFEVVLKETDNMHLGGVELARIRYLLTGDTGILTEPPSGLDEDEGAARYSYTPGQLPAGNPWNR